MTSSDIRQKFFVFFKKKGHQIVPSSPLIPLDTTVLFTTAGMQQFVSYLSGEKDILQDFNQRHLVSCQKCFRSVDIEKVGDNTHHTFFEMLGNWSIGEDSKKGYFKKGAIKYALEFLTNTLGLDKNRFWITIFKGEKGIPKDKEALEIWKQNNIPEQRIKEFGIEDNLWGPVGETGVCGPCSEIHYDRGIDYGCKDKNCGPNCLKCERFVELWNLVFMEYSKEKTGEYKPLSQRNIDTGAGLERLALVLQNKPSAYETDLFLPIIQEMEKMSPRPYISNLKPYRIIADHLRGAVFLIKEAVLPNNIERGYVLRRILRRSIRYAKVLELPLNWYVCLIKKIAEIYPEIKNKEENIITIIQNEEEKFRKTLEKGLKQFEKIASQGNISGKQLFHLYDTYGFPLELTEELIQERGLKLKIDKKGFEKAFLEHQKISRAGVKKKFGGLGIEQVENQEKRMKMTKLHTATHLLHQALRQVLGFHVRQMGSDINENRLRFDFSHSQKMSGQEIKKVQEIVNQKIKENLQVKKQEMEYEKAVEQGALAFFKEKYPQKVTVYSILDSSGKIFSKEICAGPHIEQTSELGCFEILKQESSGAGIRRIKAILK